MESTLKPQSSIAKEQTHGTIPGETIERAITGRHDLSIVIRVLPVVEAMTLLVLANMWLQSKAWS
ncbi:MAG: chorismate synthase [Ignavibacteriae bacterium]|nr:chorismate synthase [Ignavibacteriota bacterium]MCB9215976.1 chorismate synthase [Ignavibacteria bacterium]